MREIFEILKTQLNKLFDKFVKMLTSITLKEVVFLLIGIIIVEILAKLINPYSPRISAILSHKWLDTLWAIIIGDILEKVYDYIKLKSKLKD